MSPLIRRSIAPLLAAACLSGCGAPEDRINAAVPVAREVQVAHDAIAALGTGHEDLVSAVEDEYASRLKVRALTCAAGYEPSPFAGGEAIREAVGNADCFEEQDEAIAQWLGLRRLGVLLALPALREVPKAPAELLVGESGMDKVAFAREAGVAALQWKGHVRVVDVATGDAIRDVDVGLSGGLTVSDNGRVFAVGDNDSDAVVQVRDSDSGDLLMTLADVRGGKVFWLGSQALAYGLPGNDGIAVRDLASGEEQEVPFEAYQFSGALPVPGKPAQFLLSGGRRLAVLELSADKGAKIVKEITQGDDPYAALGGEPAPGPDGKLYSAAGTGVRVLDPATLEDTTIPFDPMRIARVVPTADPDALLLYGQGGRTAQTYVYSRKQNTLAVVEDGGELGSRGLRYVPALRRNAWIAGGKVVLRERHDTAAPRDAGELIDQLAFDAAIARSEQAALRERLMEQYGANRANAATPPTANLDAIRAEAERNARQAAGRPRTADDIVTDALNSGVLRLGTPSDLDAWKRLYESKSGRRIRSEFDSFSRHGKLYVIQKEFTMPSEQTGEASATWILERGAPYPRGVGHSAVLDMKSGGCTGRMCGFLLGN